MPKDTEEANLVSTKPPLKRLTALWFMPSVIGESKKEISVSLWIARINAGAHMNDMSYSKLMGGLKKANIDLDRKVLANMAILDAGAFSKVVQIAKEANA